MVGLIVHEWVERHGGSERVLEAMAEAFPDSDIVVPWNNAPEREISGRVRESWLARTPIRRSKAVAAVVLPAVWRTVVPPSTKYDWVLASSHLFSHHVRARATHGDALKFVYVHSPARYVWNPELDDRGNGRIAQLVGGALKPIDRHRAQEAQAIAANSRFVQARVEQAWRRDSTVIHPPVDVDRIRTGGNWADRLEPASRALLEKLPDHFILGASRFVSYKRLDLVIRAGEASGIPVVLAGDGPTQSLLEKMAAEASVPVYFVSRPKNDLLYALYERAAVYVFPPVEDFGMMPVEAMATGTPVVANELGGATESVVPGLSGVLVGRFAATELREAVDVALRLDRVAVAASVDRFSVTHFQRRLAEWMGVPLQEVSPPGGMIRSLA